MNQNATRTVRAAGAGSSVVDSNRFYSMLLDARTANVTEGTHDIAEKLLKGEKDSSKLALDQLWTLKKTLSDDGADETLEQIICYYQEKIDVLREKEEAIKKVSRDTRALIEEKRKKDEEMTIVKSQISGYTRDLKEINVKLEILKKREDELAVAGEQLKQEISVNEAKMVNGLSEVILSHPDDDKDGTEALEIELMRQAAEDARNRADAAHASEARAAKKKRESAPETLNNDGGAPAAPAKAAARRDEAQAHDPVVYPKSVVRMSGKVIGEYYHDGNIVMKDDRHYIYNSRFMAERLSAGLRAAKAKSGQEAYVELVKIVDDAANRVRENRRFHFEVSTNEILNDKNLRQLGVDLKRRAWEDAERFAAKLCAKIEALGLNYEAMLQEQMERCSEAD